ncbi:hypothetical protein [Flavisolibacter tropicus]|uniref:hypothetical protein n=1 Tax=Flavisolibacter tropicus TaxID=1492898 RepID=UPI0011DFB0F5|nr:hypothetical protein [Flavisolibacter tropicus]
MKKLLTLFVILVYGVASAGATLHLHYCCGKLDKISFSAAHNKDCPKKTALSSAVATVNSWNSK